MRKFLTLLKDAVSEWSTDRVPRMGAALAYYVMFSIAPLLIIAIAVASMIFGEQAAQGEIFHQIEATVGAGAAQAIEGILANVGTPEGNVVMMIVGGIILLVGASGVFVELQDSLNTIFRAPPAAGAGIWNTIRRRFLSFAMVFAIGFLLLVSLVLSAALSALGRFLTPEAMPGGTYLWQAINQVVSFGFITLLFALIYKMLPDDKLPWRDVLIGAALAAFLFTVGKYLLGVYLGQATTTSAFGAAASLVVVLIWVYYSAQILLYGAEFTRLYSLRHGTGQQEREMPAQGGESEPSEAARQEPGDGAEPSRASAADGKGNGRTGGKRGPGRDADESANRP